MSKTAYTCIFFDLDHTLWDYETNSKETLYELYDSYSLHSKGVHNSESFYLQFRKVNTYLWDLYDRGIISNEVIRNERFKRVLNFFHADEEKLCQDLSADYLRICPAKGTLMPCALEIVKYLSERYNLTVVTNGFEEIQHTKLTAGNLTGYFDHVITSQKAGYKKPARQIFEFALKLNGAACHQAIMIGDNLINDIGGARNAAIDTVFFNPEDIEHNEEVIHEIKHLKELHDIL